MLDDGHFAIGIVVEILFFVQNNVGKKRLQRIARPEYALDLASE